MTDNDKAIDLLKRIIKRLQMPGVKVTGTPKYEVEFGKSTIGKRIIPDPQKRVTNISIRTEEE
jgi:hypothetical protein